MTREKVRIRFRKGGDLRFLSHHDLMRTFERMMRRASIPFRYTEGFHPKPKMAFASALALGIVGHQEVVEVELEEALAPENIEERLAAEAPTGMDILSVCGIDPKANAQVRRACYQIAFDPSPYLELPQRITELLNQPECWVERTKPQPRRVNIRPFLLGIEPGERGLLMQIAVTPQGAARPEEVLQLLGLGDLLPSGAVLERTLLELQDECQESGVRSQESVRSH